MRETKDRKPTVPRRTGYVIGMTLTAIGVLGAVASCTSTSHPQSTGQKQENQQQATVTNKILTSQPLPDIDWSQVRQNLIEIEQSQANTTQTTSFMFGSTGNPDPIDSCPSIGDPIPGTAQLSNPMQIQHDGYPTGGAAVPVPQMDPNGVYGGDTAATYVMCVNAQGQIEPRRAEGLVHTIYGAATWDYTKHQVVLNGPASFKFSKGH